MDRREALKATSLILGYSLTAGTAAALLGGCKADTSDGWKPATLTEDEASMLAEVCEAILPKTDTPGAKDALCHRYLDEMLTHFYKPEKQAYIKQSLGKFDEVAKGKYSKAFVALNTGEREEVLSVLYAEAKEYKDDTGEKPHIFNVVREGTISGYFSSEVGAKGGLCEFLPVPGPYQGCIDYATVGKGYVL